MKIVFTSRKTGRTRSLSDIVQEKLDAIEQAAKPVVKQLERGLGEGRQSYESSKREERRLRTSVSAASRVPPWWILAGLGGLERRSLCDFLAVFESVNLLNIGADAAADWWKKLSRADQKESRRQFEKRVLNTAEDYNNSNDERHSDAWLRFQVWKALRSTLGLPRALPLSSQTAGLRCAEVADKASRHYALKSSAASGSKSLWRKGGETLASTEAKLESLVSASQRDFTQIVRHEATRAVLDALQSDQLTAEQREQLSQAFKTRLEELPEEQRDGALESAVTAGDWATVATLASAGSLAGLAIAVEIAGFSAYIVAAQASALIPFLGGQTAVSLLAVVANPLFVGLAAVGGALVMNNALTRKITQAVASNLAVHLTLQGYSGQRDGLKQCLDDFKSLGFDASADGRLGGLRARVEETLGFLPDTPGPPDTSTPKLSEFRDSDALSRVLFPESSTVLKDTLGVAGLTVADILFDAAAIDPLVVQAADFSRAEAIDGVFKFGAFAERMEGLEGLERMGLESQLRGYVAELVVATRLSDYEVSLADAPNTPGFDLLVDGNPFQVKCYADTGPGIAALEDHFSRFPDIPVYVNSELLPAAQSSGEGWADQVYGVEGFDYAHTDQIVQESLSAGADMMDPQIPLFAIAVSAARHVHGWWKGSIPLKELPFEVAVDGALHGGLAVAGGFTGSIVGVVLFGPAGAIVLSGVGELGSILGHGHARRKLDQFMAQGWTSAVGRAADDFRQELESAMDARIRRILAKAELLNARDDRLESWMRSRFHDQALAVAECKAELDDLPDPALERTRTLLRLMREAGVHPHSVRDSLNGLTGILATRPQIGDQVRGAFDRMGKRLPKIEIVSKGSGDQDGEDSTTGNRELDTGSGESPN